MPLGPPQSRPESGPERGFGLGLPKTLWNRAALEDERNGEQPSPAG